MVLEHESSSEASLVIFEAEWLERAVILAVQIITADEPKSSDAKIQRRFDKDVVVVSVRNEPIHRAEVMIVLITGSHADKEALQKALLQAGLDVRTCEVLRDQNARIVRATIAAQTEAGGIGRLIIQT
jgi:chromosome condensin MukBEF MukE localization factor